MSTKGEIIPAQADPQKSAEELWWEEDPRRLICLEMTIGGATVGGIAAPPKINPITKANEGGLGIHRNTVTNWRKHPYFVKAYNQRMAEHVAATRQRRMVQTTNLGDRIFSLADEALNRAKANPKDKEARWAAKNWLEEFRFFREQERIDFGDNVQRHDHRVGVAVGVGLVHSNDQEEQQNSREISFKEFLTKKLKDGAVDPSLAAQSNDPGQVVALLTEQALMDGELVDILYDEDLREEEANKKR